MTKPRASTALFNYVYKHKRLNQTYINIGQVYGWKNNIETTYIVFTTYWAPTGIAV